MIAWGSPVADLPGASLQSHGQRAVSFRRRCPQNVVSLFRRTWGLVGSYREWMSADQCWVERSLGHGPFVKGLHFVSSQKLENSDDVCEEIFPESQLVLVKQINCENLEEVKPKLG